MRFSPRNIRSRRALGYALAVALTVLVYAAVVYGFTRSSLTEQLDARLQEDFEHAEHGFDVAQDGSLLWKEAQGTGDHPDPNDEAPWEQVLNEAGGQAALRPPGVDPDAPVWRTYERDYVLEGVTYRVRVGRSTTPRDGKLGDLLRLLALCLAPAVALAWCTGFALARRALRPVEVMTERARLIGAERLHERLSVDNRDDELGRLAVVFNEAFGRIEVSFERLRRFTSDAAHELRTPLAALRAVGEVGITGGGDGAASREVIASMLEEADRLTRLIEGLLELSRGDARGAATATEAIDLVELARSVCDQLEVLALDRQQTLVVVANGPAVVQGEPASLRRAIMNLVDNAIRHGPPSASVRVHVDADGNGAALTISDEGPGIPPEHLPRIFDRFYCADASRKGSSTGLGLPLAAQAVEAHGGGIAHETRPGGGTTFRVNLPTALSG